MAITKTRIEKANKGLKRDNRVVVMFEDDYRQLSERGIEGLGDNGKLIILSWDNDNKNKIKNEVTNS